MDKRNIQLIGQRIHDYLDKRMCDEPACPFVVGGTIIRDLSLTKAEFYMGIAYLIDYNRGYCHRRKEEVLLPPRDGGKVSGLAEWYRDWRNGNPRRT